MLHPANGKGIASNILKELEKFWAERRRIAIPGYWKTDLARARGHSLYKKKIGYFSISPIRRIRRMMGQPVVLYY